jgi:hypothetical protein
MGWVPMARHRGQPLGQKTGCPWLSQIVAVVPQVSNEGESGHKPKMREADISANQVSWR